MSARQSLAEKLARPEIRALAPFDIAETGPDPDAILLDSNESPFAPMGTDVPVNRYPESQPQALRARMAALYGVERENLWVTRGADDAIELLVRSFCNPGEDAIAISSPTFTAYERFAAVQGARVIDVALDSDFDLRADALAEAILADGKVKLAFVCSPANPTGNVVPPADILALADRLPDTIVVADEAYVEFAEVESLAREAATRENLVVLRTLSKAFGLAGARVGALVGHPDTVAMTSRASPFYPLPVPSIEAAMAALGPSRRSLHERRIAELLDERDAGAHERVDHAAGRGVGHGGEAVGHAVGRGEELGFGSAGRGFRGVGGLAGHLGGRTGLVNDLLRNGFAHSWPPSSCPSAGAGAKFGCTMRPSRVSAVAFTSSSSQSIANALVSLSTITPSTNVSRFLA